MDRRILIMSCLILGCSSREESPVDILNCANAAVHRGAFDEAIRDYTEAIRRDPNYALAYMNRGVAYAKKGNLDRAIEQYTEALRLDPKMAVAYRNRARDLLAKEDFDRAIADLTESLRLEPDHADAFSDRAYGYLKKKRFDEAKSDYESLIRRSPNNAAAHNTLAWLLATCPKAVCRDGTKAVELARKACELSEWKEPTHLGTLAAAYAESGKFDEAVRWQAKALESAQYSQFFGKEARERLKSYQEGKAFHEE
jgi:tetratricopeptide (TPR) repeat protein